MQKKVESKVLEYCKKHKLLHVGDRIVAGVSGGADSVCLLFVLLSLQKEFDLKLHVVHVHHGIRFDAGEDADFVKGLCREKNVPFTLVERDIPLEAREKGCSEEEAGRKARYEVFETVRQREGFDKIAVAHNANDCAETMLFHLFRGTGLTGLGGIRPMRQQIIRPLLCLERAEIEAYLECLDVKFCHDSTNDSDDYTRNKIRHHILPYAEEEIVQGTLSNMMRTADILAETEDYIEEQVQSSRRLCVREDVENACGGKIFRMNCADYRSQHTVIQKRLLLALLKELSPMHKDIAAVHVEAVHSLFMQEGNRRVDLPYGIRGIREYAEVLLERREEEPLKPSGQDVPVGELLQEKGKLWWKERTEFFV